MKKIFKLRLKLTDFLHPGLAVILLSLAAYVRLVNLTINGMIGADVFQYWQIAKWWTEGNFTLDGFYRPGLYIVDSLGILLFGKTDYALSFLHAVMDIFNIILIYLIALNITKHKWLSTLCAMLYAFYPVSIFYSRISLAHIPSATFVLLTVWLFLKFYQTLSIKKSAMVILSLTGLTASMAAHTHPDLALLAPTYILLIAGALPNKLNLNRRQFLLKWLLYSSIFSAAFFSLYLIGVFIFGIFRVVQILIWENNFGREYNPPWTLFNSILINSMATHTFKFMPFIYLFILPLPWLLRKTKRFSIFLYSIPLLLPLGYSLAGSFILTRYITRVFIPMIPLITIALVIWIYQLLYQITKNKNLSFTIISGLVLFFTYINLTIYKPQLLETVAGKQTYYREVYDVLKEKVNSQNKILITPYITYSHRKGFQYPMYFGENARYIIEFGYGNQDLNQLIQGEKIRYIYIGKSDLDKRILQQPPTEVPVDFYGLRQNDWKNGYTVEKELDILSRYLNSARADKIFESDQGTIYRL